MAVPQEGLYTGRLLDSFDEDHFGLRSGLAEGFGRGVFGGVPPFARDFRRGKFDNDDAARGPVAFEDFHFAAANEKAAAVFFDRGEDGFAVVLVTDRVVDFDTDEDVGGHFCCSLEESRNSNAEAERRRRKKERKKERRKSTGLKTVHYKEEGGKKVKRRVFLPAGRGDG